MIASDDVEITFGNEVPQRYFHPQYAICEKQRKKFVHQKLHQAAAGDSFTAEEARALGNTTWFQRQYDGSFLFRPGKVFTRQGLVLWGAERGFSTFELYYYYNNCFKIVQKREHPAAPSDRRDAARLRKKSLVSTATTPVRFDPVAGTGTTAAAGAVQTRQPLAPKAAGAGSFGPV